MATIKINVQYLDGKTITLDIEASTRIGLPIADPTQALPEAFPDRSCQLLETVIRASGR